MLRHWCLPDLELRLRFTLVNRHVSLTFFCKRINAHVKQKSIL